jgi:23S rRNA (uracil1939-C5)-methyltransferase
MNKPANLDKPKEAATAHIHGMSHDGRGITTIDNKTTFMAGALTNETVTYRINQKRSTYYEAEALSILETSTDRATPPCKHFGVCGGCSLQHMTIDAQITLKQATLLDQLKRFGQVTPQSILPPLNALSVGYRRKARLGAKFVIKKDKLMVGFREKSSNYLADLESCVVLHPKVGLHLHTLSALVRSLEAYYHIPQIEVAMGDTAVALVFRHLVPLTETDKQILIAFGKEHDFHIYLQPNSPETISKLWPDDQQQRLTYTLPDEKLEFLFHPLDFTQINLELNRLMVSQALTLLDLKATDSVLDLYCGIGNFTLPIARHVATVTGVEGGNEMVERANDNAAHNHITNATFYAANLEKPPTHAPWMQQQYDKILLDPPRVGAIDLLPHLQTFNAKKIVYVSCNPATLARDAGLLVNQYGYTLTAAGIMNMFPHTAHIEAMAVFEKK